MRVRPLRLHISQSAIARQIQLMEHDLGGRVLERTSAGVRPTNGGHALAEKAKGLVAVTRVRRFVDLTTQFSDLNHFFPRGPRLIDH